MVALSRSLGVTSALSVQAAVWLAGDTKAPDALGAIGLQAIRLLFKSPPFISAAAASYF
jgi:hypothetical protein